MISDVQTHPSYNSMLITFPGAEDMNVDEEARTACSDHMSKAELDKHKELDFRRLLEAYDMDDQSTDLSTLMDGGLVLEDVQISTSHQRRRQIMREAGMSDAGIDRALRAILEIRLNPEEAVAMGMEESLMKRYQMLEAFEGERACSL
jgi:hypothetical protein